LGQLVEAHGAGLAIEVGDSQGLAAAILSLAQDREACRKLGVQARRALDEHFPKRRSLEVWQGLLRDVHQNDA
jgi:hypothetical protein